MATRLPLPGSLAAGLLVLAGCQALIGLESTVESPDAAGGIDGPARDGPVADSSGSPADARELDAGPDAAVAICPNGVVEAGEACDDGNNADDDRCTNACLLAGHLLESIAPVGVAADEFWMAVTNDGGALIVRVASSEVGEPDRLIRVPHDGSAPQDLPSVQVRGGGDVVATPAGVFAVGALADTGAVGVQQWDLMGVSGVVAQQVLEEHWPGLAIAPNGERFIGSATSIRWHIGQESSGVFASGVDGRRILADRSVAAPALLVSQDNVVARVFEGGTAVGGWTFPGPIVDLAQGQRPETIWILWQAAGGVWLTRLDLATGAATPVVVGAGAFVQVAVAPASGRVYLAGPSASLSGTIDVYAFEAPPGT